MVQVMEEKPETFELNIIKTRMKRVPDDQPNIILVVLDALNYTAWEKYKSKLGTTNIEYILKAKAKKVHSFACCTLPALVGFLSNYPPIGVGFGLFDKGIIVEVPELLDRGKHHPTRAWMPRWYKEKGYHTSIFTGNAVIAEADQEMGIRTYFDHWGVIKYLKEDVLNATPRIIEDFTALCLEEGAPLFSILWLFDTHYPFSDGKRVLNPHFRDGYETMKACVRALKYTDEEVFPAIAEALKSTGRLSKVVVTSDHGENHGSVGNGHNPFHSKLRMSDDLFAIPYIEGEIEA